jgi:hypothetical protein
MPNSTRNSNLIDISFGNHASVQRGLARENHYRRFFGELTEPVWHSTDDKAPHIDVYQFAPGQDRDFWTLITGGMSDLRQPGLKASQGEYAPRAELLMYVQEPKPWMINVLKGLAEMPFDDDTFLYWGHTVPNGKPMTVAPSSLTSFFFDQPCLEDPTLLDLTIDGDGVAFLWLRPIAESERAYAIEHGGQALSELFASVDMDPVVDETRKPIV